MNYTDATIIDPEHTFTSTVVLPDDVRVEVVVTIPDRVAWPDVAEVAEYVQMAATTVRSGVLRSRAAANERVPF